MFEQLTERSPDAIAGYLARLISTGELAPGDRLPTVREAASALGVSPATVSQSWQALSRAGLITSRGRAGSFVSAERREWLPPRTLWLAGHGEPARLDLSRGAPDPSLLPSLTRALGRVSARAETTSYHEAPVLPELGRVLQERWPAASESLTVVDGAMDAVSRSLEAVARFGDRVIVESPAFPPFFDLLETLGLERVPVGLDADGILPGDLQAALRLKPTALLLQPRAQNPTGASMTPERAEELARVISTSRDADDLVIIEDDHSGAISTSPDVSLGRWLPDRVLHVQSFSKSHGPDLRIAALGGPGHLVDRVVARRMLGPGWTSRMTQGILFELLTDGSSLDEVAEARRQYDSRQRSLRDALAGFGVTLPRADGINLWLPVADERSALVQLAAAGIRVAPGAPFVAGDSARGADHVRVTAGMVAEEAPAVASALAAAALPTPSAAFPLLR
ncbi:aminotransferase-like domain-containing protein [Agromyces atrinae]|uniref:Aminotransferase class I/II-fold pyridoxal phosphate-dependent enzyme n=1 Tax=Agromyces atrinae TaxID=592376 RepID=A0A4Q2MCG3_9MICO|nr:aminotransferase class I/II-fold pyridoxal phosphate-dependent enzyme [Agromyces atrinae]NYD68122.1 DNA-binding transcriptional MocR family regulator [Agromyces atrinae]RXZ87732.1 aminotransferase class I/II-fold pyridoxal phosphate-dependent enzyme [Agromyces atrinae]